MIRRIEREDIPACAAIMREVYNNPLWQCRWNEKTSEAYLTDYFEAKKFLGFVCEIENEGGGREICAAMFCHEKIWWNNSELFIDEMFVLPSMQRRGYGSALLEAGEEYIKEKALAGFTLTTNRHSFAPAFYEKNGFERAEHILYMYKSMENGQ
ncbi:MAG: GNAT family N-acetyltransferase [Eubacteriaceae bacterium]|nr:GNAT family N-acetyltransferase [Eubacteriaceae bacterium]